MNRKWPWPIADPEDPPSDQEQRPSQKYKRDHRLINRLWFLPYTPEYRELLTGGVCPDGRYGGQAMATRYLLWKPGGNFNHATGVAGAWPWNGVPFEITETTTQEDIYLFLVNATGLKGSKEVYDAYPFAIIHQPTIIELEYLQYQYIVNIRRMVKQRKSLTPRKSYFVYAQKILENFLYDNGVDSAPGVTYGTTTMSCEDQNVYADEWYECLNASVNYTVIVFKTAVEAHLRWSRSITRVLQAVIEQETAFNNLINTNNIGWAWEWIDDETVYPIFHVVITHD